MSFSAVVLAAGRSRRMGFPKAGLLLDEEYLVVRLTRLSLEAGARHVAVVLGSEKDQKVASRVYFEPRLKKALPGGGYTIAVGEPEGTPLDSLRAGLQISPEEDDLLLWPVDQPFADAELVRALHAAIRPDAIAVPQMSDERGHPVLFGRLVWPELYLGDLPEGARTVVRRDPSRVIAVPARDPRILASLNTPEDAERAGLKRP